MLSIMVMTAAIHNWERGDMGMIKPVIQKSSLNDGLWVLNPTVHKYPNLLN